MQAAFSLGRTEKWCKKGFISMKQTQAAATTENRAINTETVCEKNRKADWATEESK